MKIPTEVWMDIKGNLVIRQFNAFEGYEIFNGEYSKIKIWYSTSFYLELKDYTYLGEL